MVQTKLLLHWYLCTFCCVFFQPGANQDSSRPKEILKRAIEAQGGEAFFAKYLHYHVKTKGILYNGLGQEAPYTLAYYYVYPSKSKYTARFEINKEYYEISRVLNGGEGWTAKNGIKQNATAHELETVP